MSPPSQATESDAGISKSGIATSATGNRVIPSSTRADGSTRREIKIRPGYRPPEDVEVYKNRTAEAWRGRGTGGVPGAEGLANTPTSESKSAASNKNAKRREARKRAKAAEATDEPDDTPETQDAPNGDAPSHEEKDSGPTEANSSEQTQADAEKKIKRLKKKLREARELQAKKEKGEGLLQEQFEKVIKIRELMRELEKLGVNDNGDAVTESHEDHSQDPDSKEQAS